MTIRMHPRTAALFALLIAANLAAWGRAWAAFHDRPALLSTALLAWVFGLRHAVDADHIAAIDNVVRKLMQKGRRPVAVGFFFSLGHSTVGVVASVAVAAAAASMQDRLEATKAIGGVIGTAVAAAFLLAIAITNLLVLRGVWGAFRETRRTGRLDETQLSVLLAGRGFVTRLFRPLFRLISRSWHMYPLGFLFGLGFDPANEIGLLGIAATEAAHGLPSWQILVFPALFTAGLALLIGGLGALGLIASQLGLDGRFWSAVGDLNDDLAYFRRRRRRPLRALLGRLGRDLPLETLWRAGAA